MKDYSNIPVKVAFLHQTVQIPGVFGGEKTLSDQRIPGIKMTYTPHGIVVEVKGLKGIVPLANVAIAVLDESDAPADSVAALKSKKSTSAQVV